jgi:concentrative nucleoside transporter, CNT family
MKRISKTVLGLWLVAATLLVTGIAIASPIGAEFDTSLELSASGGSTASTENPSAPPVMVPQATSIASFDQSLDTPFLQRLRSLFGLAALAFVAWLMSVNRGRVPWRVVFWGLGLQMVFALIILKTPVGLLVFGLANDVVVALLGFTVDGAQFLFGNLVWNSIPVGTGAAGAAGEGIFTPTTGTVANAGALFAFNVLPTIIFFSALMTVMYHLGTMQFIVKGFAWVMQRTMGTSGAETLSATGNIFVGQTEAPLLIKPFIEQMTRSELMAVMTAGFATVAGGVMAAYVGMLLPYFPDIAGHLMAASVMSAPAALVVAKLMYPEEGEPKTGSSLELAVERPDVNVIDAAARGAGEGLQLALNVGAMLLAFVALVAMLDAILGLAGGLVGFDSLSLQMILGWFLAPVAWLMGVPWSEAGQVGALLGLKTALNEFIAFLQLSALLGDGSTLSPRSVIIATYALSGFANFSSIAIQIGGIGGIAPSRRHDLSALGLRAMIGGTLAAFMTATVAGMLV